MDTGASPSTLSANGRTADHPIDPIFLERWSPRAFTGEDISPTVLMRIFEAARWAPSSYNSQPWRFLYARRSSPQWAQFLGLLNEFNRSWSAQAGALVVIVSAETMVVPGQDTPVPSHSHSFDAGSAWGYMALQATREGWQAHGMVGFDKERAFAELGVPPGHRVEAMVAIGRHGNLESLPEGLRARDTPSARKPLEATVFEGAFPKPD